MVHPRFVLVPKLSLGTRTKRGHEDEQQSLRTNKASPFIQNSDKPITSKMTTERPMKILQHLTRHDSLEVGQLSQLLQVSPSTIRRELRVMQQSGLFRRMHGTAQLPTPIRYESPYENRAAQQVEAKRKIGATAKRMIERELIVGISGGATCAEVDLFITDDGIKPKQNLALQEAGLKVVVAEG